MSANEPPADDEPTLLAGGGRWGTIGLIFLNLAVGLVMAWTGVPMLMARAADVIAFGAVDPALVWQGEVVRLLTGCFVHVGAWHLGLNLWVLWQVGRALERLVGAARLVLVYVVSGIFGFALSIALLPGLTAGASGAIFGVTGALLALAALTRQQRLGRFLLGALLPFVLATFALGVLVPMVNNVAHFGGLAIGFVLGFGLAAGDRSFLHLDDTDERAAAEATVGRVETVLGLAALVTAFVAFAGVTAYALEPRWSPRFHAVMGLRALRTAAAARTTADQNAAVADAREHATRAAALGPDDAATLVLAGQLAAREGDAETARQRTAQAFALWQQASRDRNAAFEQAAAELALLEPDEDMPFADGRTTRALCTAALDDDGRKQAGPDLKNSCAWLLLRAREPAVRDAQLALPLAREAWEESERKRPDITHTYAEALAQTGAAAEGLALLEQLAVSDGVGTLGRSFVDAERTRLARLVIDQRRPQPETPTGHAADAGPADAGPVDAGPDDAGPVDAGPDDAGPEAKRAENPASPGSPDVVQNR
jgi:membrane associated rhomboid family serine protease